MQNKDSSFEKRVTLTIIILFINLILISNSVILENNRSIISNILYTIISPVQIVWTKSIDFISDTLDHYIFVKNSQRKIIELKKKNRELWYKNFRLKKIIHSLDKGKFPSLKNKSYIIVNVVSLNTGSPLSGAIIDHGFMTGVKKDMIVLNERMELVGKITEPITFFSANVKFITNPIGGVGAYIYSNKLEGLLKGDNSETCHFNYIIGNRKVNIGDLVVTSGTDMIYSAYINIGKVVKVEKKSLLQNIFVKPFFVDNSIKKLILMEKK